MSASSGKRRVAGQRHLGLRAILRDYRIRTVGQRVRPVSGCIPWHGSNLPAEVVWVSEGSPSPTITRNPFPITRNRGVDFGGRATLQHIWIKRTRVSPIDIPQPIIVVSEYQ